MNDNKSTTEFYNLNAQLLNNLTNPPPIEISDIEKAIGQLKLNKSPDAVNLFSEHFLYSHPSIVTHLKSLFNLILNHSYVPQCFTHGIVIPIIKDKRGDATELSNYRPITISSTISKFFECFLFNSFLSFLTSDPLQFGYKLHTGCPNAIFLLRRVIQHFNNRSSSVYVASIDASKAFDGVNHYKLFSILIKKGLPSYFVHTLHNWYSRLNVKIK